MTDMVIAVCDEWQRNGRGPSGDAQGIEQERARLLPFAFDRSLGDPEGSGHFVDVETGEEPHLYDSCLPFVERFQPPQRFVEGEEILS